MSCPHFFPFPSSSPFPKLNGRMQRRKRKQVREKAHEEQEKGRGTRKKIKKVT
jgi:hypothetical protein